MTIVTPENHGPLVNVAMWIALPPMIMSTGGKIWTKWESIRKVQLDDYLLLFSMVTSPRKSESRLADSLKVSRCFSDSSYYGTSSFWAWKKSKQFDREPDEVFLLGMLNLVGTWQKMLILFEVRIHIPTSIHCHNLQREVGSASVLFRACGSTQSEIYHQIQHIVCDSLVSYRYCCCFFPMSSAFDVAGSFRRMH